MTGLLETIVPGADIRVELGIGDTRQPVGQAVWDVALWDDDADLWVGTEPTWYDITCDVTGISSHTGRDRSADRWDVGTCQVTVRNGTGWADILLPPQSPATLAVRPGRPLRWGVSIDDGPVVWRWRGFADVVEATYAGRYPALDTVTLAGIDALGEAGRAKLVTLGAPVGGGETATARIDRILDAAGWRAVHRLLDATSVTVAATDLNGSVIDLLGVTADSAGGAVYGDSEGRVRFRGRDWQTWMPGTPVDATIGNIDATTDNELYWHTDGLTFDGDTLIFGSTTAAAAVCPTAFDGVRFARADATTRGIVARQGGTEHVADDVTGQIVYGIETSPTRSDLIAEDDSQLDLLADRLIRTRGVDTMPRLATVELDAANSAAHRDLIAAADPTTPSRYRCVLVRAGRTVFDRTMFATAVDHTINGTSWHCRLTLDDALPWQATGGMWDEASWDQALWGDLISGLEALLADVRKVTA